MSNAQLFQHAAMFGDIHYGLRQNSKQHLEDCENFITWFIQQSQARGAETCFFLGDWHHHRSSVNVATMNASIRDMKRLNDAFEQVFFITGNHDLYYRDKRDLNSVEFARDLSNFRIIDQLFVQDDVAIVPWLVEDEWRKLTQLQCKYMFGHFEFPRFKMNAMVEMPDHGGIRAEQLTAPDYIFSGHFHKRQQRNNVIYIGNPFGHNYADAGDFDRGCAFIKWGQAPEMINWPDGPKYLTTTLKHLIDHADDLLDNTVHARVSLDVGVSYEEANFIRETFTEKYGVREIHLIRPKGEAAEHEGIEIKFESVDQIVISQLETIESNLVDKNKLIQMYRDLDH